MKRTLNNFLRNYSQTHNTSQSVINGATTHSLTEHIDLSMCQPGTIKPIIGTVFYAGTWSSDRFAQFGTIIFGKNRQKNLLFRLLHNLKCSKCNILEYTEGKCQRQI